MIERRLANTQLLILAIVGLGFAIVYGINWYAALTYQYAIEYEGPMLWAANTLANGQNIYDPQRLIQAPWAVITYPPLFICAAALLVKSCGTNYWCLRIVTMASAIAAIFFFFRILRRSGCAPVPAAIGPAYLIGYSPVFLWANLGRPDTMALALSLAGLERSYFAWRETAEERRSITPLIVAGVVFALACFTKQTSVVCGASAVLFLLWCKQFKNAAILLTTQLTAFILLSAMAQLSTGGFLQNITVFSKAHWDADILLRYLHFMSSDDVTRLELSFLVLLFCIVVRKQETSETERLPYILFAFSLAQMLYIMGLPGSNGNHAIFTLLALSWWLALKAATLPARFGQVILICSLIGAPSLAGRIPSLIAALPRDWFVLRGAGLRDKIVLSEDPYLNILSHSKPAMIDCAVFTSIWQNRPEKLDEIKQAIARQELAGVIINCQDSQGEGKYFWPEPILQSLREHYSASGKLSGNGICQTLWLPRSRP